MQHRALHATHAARHASLTFSLPCLWSACHHLVDLKPADERAVGGPRIRLELEDEVGAGTHGGRKVIHKGEGVGDECTIAGHHVVGLDLRDGHTIHKRGENTLASLHACREERGGTGAGEEGGRGWRRVRMQGGDGPVYQCLCSACPPAAASWHPQCSCCST